MPLAPNISSVVTRIATEFKTFSARIGSLTSLTTTDKTSLVAAVNEVKAASLNAGAQINDNIAGTGTVYSSAKTDSQVAAAVAGLVNSAPAALDTLAELSAALGGDAAFATTTATALGNRVRFDAVQTLTGAQQTQARANIGAGTSNLAIGSTSTTAKAGDYAPPAATTGATGLIQLAGMLGGTATAPTVRSATTALTGAVQLATSAEATAGTDAAKAITPATMKTVTDTLATTASVGNTETDFVAVFTAGLV